MPGARELGGQLRIRTLRRRPRDPTSSGPAIHTEAPNEPPPPEEPMPEVANPSLRRGSLSGGFGFDSGFTGGEDPLGGGVLGGGPGSIACTLAGLDPNCTWAEMLMKGVDAAGFGGGNGNGSGDSLSGESPCPGLTSVYDPITGRCVNIMDAAPGGDPLFSAPTGEAVKGMYGAGFRPSQETITRRKCPRGTVLGDDGVCYKGLARTRRMWDPGMKPLLTGGDRAAIRKAAAAARKLKRSKKQIKQAAKALERVC